MKCNLNLTNNKLVLILLFSVLISAIKSNNTKSNTNNKLQTEQSEVYNTIPKIVKDLREIKLTKTSNIPASTTTVNLPNISNLTISPVTFTHNLPSISSTNSFLNNYSNCACAALVKCPPCSGTAYTLPLATCPCAPRPNCPVCPRRGQS